MPRWQRLVLCASAAVIGGAALYVISQYAGWPRLTLHPYRREVTFEPPGGSAIALGFFGIALWSLIGALGGAAIGAAGGLAWRRPMSEGAMRLVGGWALTAIGVATLYAVWTIWPF